MSACGAPVESATQQTQETPAEAPNGQAVAPELKKPGASSAGAPETDLAETTGALTAQYWTPWVSEENGGPATVCSLWNQAALGFGCRGDYCDDVRLACDTLPFGFSLDPPTDYWSGYYSEENDGFGTYVSESWYGYDGSYYEVCNWWGGAPAMVSGIKCRGDYCDDISIECTQLKKSDGTRVTGANLTDCFWTGRYSEEQGSVILGSNRWIMGISCSGDYCDDKQYYVCSLTP
jgi:hypothetical protein